MTRTSRLIRATALVAALALSAPLLAGCASDDVEIAPLAHAYNVVLLPIEGAEQALAPPIAEDAVEGEVPFSITPEELRTRIKETILGSRVFSRIVNIDASQLFTDEFTDEVQAAVPFAREQRADLIMRVRVNSARMIDLGPNDSKTWSTFVWFMVPAPLWLADDRTYGTSLSVSAEMYDPEDPVRPAASVVASSSEHELDLWDRGVWDPMIFVLPAPWVDGDLETVSQELTARAATQMLEELVSELRDREIPSRFDVAYAWDGNTIEVEIGSRRRLRALEIRVDGEVMKSWAERETQDLHDDRRSTADRIVYRAQVPVTAEMRGQLVRMVAVDEAGGREVRTLRAGADNATPKPGGDADPAAKPAPTKSTPKATKSPTTTPKTAAPKTTPPKMAKPRFIKTPKPVTPNDAAKQPVKRPAVTPKPVEPEKPPVYEPPKNPKRGRNPSRRPAKKIPPKGDDDG